MTNKDYHADTTRISKSALDAIARSPLHYWYKYLNPDRAPEKRSDALAFGSAFHSLVLEPEKFHEEFVLAPEINRRTNAGKEEWAVFQELHEGKDIITPEDWDTLHLMRDAVMANKIVAQLLSKGVAEQTITFTEPETGIACKVRPDWITPDRIVVDLKTTSDASPEGFGKSAWNYRYDVQAAFYTDAMSYMRAEFFNELPPKAFLFVAVEKDAPHAVALYFSTAELIDSGRSRYMKDLRTYKKCLETGIWRGYSPEIEPLHLPAWAAKTNKTQNYELI